MGSILSMVVIGLVVGFVARALHPGKESIGFLMTAVLGVGGSLFASFAGQFLGLYKDGQTAGWIASIIGAIVLLVAYGFIKNKAAGGGA